MLVKDSLVKQHTYTALLLLRCYFFLSHLHYKNCFYGFPHCGVIKSMLIGKH